VRTFLDKILFCGTLNPVRNHAPTSVGAFLFWTAAACLR